LINGAPRARSVSVAFLAAFQDHFEDRGKGIFDVLQSNIPLA
jgi:NAD(P)H-dependent FMN reductase